MSDYFDLLKGFLRVGLSAERPAVPPDRQSLFWDIEAGVLYGAAEDMTWFSIAAIGSIALNDLSDVVLTTPAASDALVFNGTNWVNSALGELVRDFIGVALTEGANISITVSDPADTITIAVTGLTASSIADFSEAVDDRVAALLVAGTNIVLNYNDVANTLTISLVSAPTISDFTNMQHDHLDTDDGGTLTAAAVSDFSEAVDDRVNALLVAGTLIDLTYDDGANTLTIDVDLTEAASDNTPTATSEFIYLDGPVLKRGTFDAAAVASGTLIYERGGMEADLSAFDGVPKISGGATSQIDVWEKIDTQVLGSDTASITFSSIPSTFVHLKIEFLVRTDNAATSDSLGIRFNSDSGNNYNSMRQNISHSATLVTTETLAAAQLQFFVIGDSGIAFATGEIVIPGYAVTGRPRVCFQNGGRLLSTATGNVQTTAGVGEWTNTAAAISTILLFPIGGSNFKSGTRISLYGAK